MACYVICKHTHTHTTTITTTTTTKICVFVHSDAVIFFFFFLVLGGADINKCNKHGHSPLFLAAKEGEMDAVKALVAAKADINLSTNETGGYTPLIAAAANEHKPVIAHLVKVRNLLS
jgi:ankyrin repeat protein